jgi:transcriptional activator SPT7
MISNPHLFLLVIKNPMDLGTVSKKLKQFQYKSKADLSKDLHLIYENCLIYNTDPHSEYRKHAIAMRRKTDRLLSRVPDIVIKERHDHDIDGDDPMDDAMLSDEELVDSTTPIKSLGKHRERTNSISRASRERSITHESLDESSPILRANYGGKYPQKGVASSGSIKPSDNEIDAAREELTMNNEIDTDKGELQNQIWREITKKTRGKVAADIEKQYQFDFGNRHAITQSSVDVEWSSLLERLHHQPKSTKKLIRCSRLAFLRWLERHEGIEMSIYDQLDMNSEDEEGFDGGFFFSRSDRPKPTDENDAIRNDLFLPEYAIIPGLPEIEGVPEELIEPEYDDEEDSDKSSIQSIEHRSNEYFGKK